MELLTILQGLSAAAVRPVGGGYGHIPDAIKAFVERYSFAAFPKESEIVAATSTATSPNSPAAVLNFYQGKWSNLAIDNLQIYPAGIGVIARLNTERCDAILSDILAWAESQFRFSFEELKSGFGHSSQVEFRFVRPLSEMLPQLGRVSDRISAGIEPFFGCRPSFELTSLSFFYDKGKAPQFAPTSLRIDRRDAVPFEKSVYWSEAPLSTENHMAALTELEDALLDLSR